MKEMIKPKPTTVREIDDTKDTFWMENHQPVTYVPVVGLTKKRLSILNAAVGVAE